MADKYPGHQINPGERDGREKRKLDQGVDVGVTERWRAESQRVNKLSNEEV